MFDQRAGETDGTEFKNRLPYPVQNRRPAQNPVFCKNKRIPGIRRTGKISNPGVPQKPLRDIRQAHHYGFGIVNDSIELHAISL
jgi:hypothetical protein